MRAQRGEIFLTRDTHESGGGTLSTIGFKPEARNISLSGFNPTSHGILDSVVAMGGGHK